MILVEYQLANISFWFLEDYKPAVRQVIDVLSDEFELIEQSFQALWVLWEMALNTSPILRKDTTGISTDLSNLYHLL